MSAQTKGAATLVVMQLSAAIYLSVTFLASILGACPALGSDQEVRLLGILSLNLPFETSIMAATISLGALGGAVRAALDLPLRLARHEVGEYELVNYLIAPFLGGAVGLIVFITSAGSGLGAVDCANGQLAPGVLSIGVIAAAGGILPYEAVQRLIARAEAHALHLRLVGTVSPPGEGPGNETLVATTANRSRYRHGGGRNSLL